MIVLLKCLSSCTDTTLGNTPGGSPEVDRSDLYRLKAQ